MKISGENQYSYSPEHSIDLMISEAYTFIGPVYLKAGPMKPALSHCPWQKFSYFPSLDFFASI
jgi:hypothetical protein